MQNNRLFNIVLLGGPGSGKGTQATLVREKYNLEHLSTGQLFRHEIAIKSEIGLKAKKVIDKGNYCSDEITLDILNKHIALVQNPKGFVFDGVPRTLDQAKRMDGVDYAPAVPVTMVINLVVDDDEMVKRILKRAELEGRSDDTRSIVRQRIKNYHTLTVPLIEYYANQGKLYQVNGMQTKEKIAEDISQLIDKKIKEQNNTL